MLFLVLLLFAAGAVFTDHQEYSGPPQTLLSRFRAVCVPARIAGGWAPESPLSMTSPSPSQLITAWCGEQTLLVMVMLGTESLVQAVELRLGATGCSSVWADPQTDTVLFYTNLSECGILRKVSEHQLVYSTHLYYRPRAAASAAVRSSLAIAGIECYYPRKVIGDKQTGLSWTPLSSPRSKWASPRYSLHLMSDNWREERSSSRYQLGDLIHIEASVSAKCLPVRLYIDSCVATPTPDQDSTLRRRLLGFNGCLLDSRSAGSLSIFVSPRAHPNKLQMRLDTFRLLEAGSSIFITCRLKVSAIDARADSANKACTFQKAANRWFPVEGPAGICACCDWGNCGEGRRRWSTGSGWNTLASQFEDEQLQMEGEVQIGPLEILSASLQDPVPRVWLGSQNMSHMEEAPWHGEVATKTLLISVVLVAVIALLLSVLLVGGIVICGALTFLNLNHKLTRFSV
ncbi:zona pellucida sperm-binding protein 3-like [Hypanus sabinus]|uniref:zona pellucida sperm-binding protein 3-like n=1 Tax=Hypanus sabinus TaxID=79690 RepID=UPI0028C4B531|nr:zona pellucida sperm-binding protein 3-like [Hypanus sabinus]